MDGRKANCIKAYRTRTERKGVQPFPLFLALGREGGEGFRKAGWKLKSFQPKERAEVSYEKLPTRLLKAKRKKHVRVGVLKKEIGERSSKKDVRSGRKACPVKQKEERSFHDAEIRRKKIIYHGVRQSVLRQEKFSCAADSLSNIKNREKKGGRPALR